jgi:hypothetical protein
MGAKHVGDLISKNVRLEGIKAATYRFTVMRNTLLNIVERLNEKEENRTMASDLSDICPVLDAIVRDVTDYCVDSSESENEKRRREAWDRVRKELDEMARLVKSGGGAFFSHVSGCPNLFI